MNGHSQHCTCGRCQKAELTAAASAGYGVLDSAPDICHECMEKVLCWLDKMGTASLDGAKMNPAMRRGLEEIAQSFRFVEISIRARR